MQFDRSDNERAIGRRGMSSRPAYDDVRGGLISAMRHYGRMKRVAFPRTREDMMSSPLGAANPELLAQYPDLPRPHNADSLPIAITEWGSSSPLVLMVHGGVQGGIGGGPANFCAQEPLAERGWRLRLLDRPGFGKNPSRGPDDTLADAVIIAEQSGDGAPLVGHSFGGAGALLAAGVDLIRKALGRRHSDAGIFAASSREEYPERPL